MAFEQRVARSFEEQAMGRDCRRNAVIVAGKAGAGLKCIDQCQNARAFDYLVSVAADLAGERNEYAMNLSLLFFNEAHEFVVLLDGFERLNIDCLPGGTGAVDDAADAPLQLGTDGNNEAVAANGDEIFLGGAVAGELAESGAEGLLDQALLSLLITANPVELR